MPLRYRTRQGGCFFFLGYSRHLIEHPLRGEGLTGHILLRLPVGPFTLDKSPDKACAFPGFFESALRGCQLDVGRGQLSFTFFGREVRLSMLGLRDSCSVSLAAVSAEATVASAWFSSIRR